MDESGRKREIAGPKSPSNLNSVRRSAKPRSARKGKEESSVLIALLFPVVAILMWFGLQHARHDSADESEGRLTSALSQEQLNERVKFHRETLGRRLNRERISAQFENQTTAPPLPSSSIRVEETERVLAGLPLASEPHHRGSSHDRKELESPEFADTRVQYSLQEQQRLSEMEQRARKQYIEDFITNASKAGYRVKVDKNGVVTVIGRNPAGFSMGPNRAAEAPGFSASPSKLDSGAMQ